MNWRRVFKKGDLVVFEHLATHPSGVGWQFQKQFGIVVGYNSSNDTFSVMIGSGTIVERTEIQLDRVKPEELPR